MSAFFIKKDLTFISVYCIIYSSITFKYCGSIIYNIYGVKKEIKYGNVEKVIYGLSNVKKDISTKSEYFQKIEDYIIDRNKE